MSRFNLSISGSNLANIGVGEGLQTLPYKTIAYTYNLQWTVMSQEIDFHHRQATRLSGYDYSQSGAHFVTICTFERQCTLSSVIDGKVQWSQAGTIVWACWNDLPNNYPHVELDSFVIMPNHVHGVLHLIDVDTPAKRHALPEIIRGLKTYSSRRINEQFHQTGASVWQRSFCDHVIRNEHDLNRIREYIQNNPLSWTEDEEYPSA